MGVQTYPTIGVAACGCQGYTARCTDPVSDTLLQWSLLCPTPSSWLLEPQQHEGWVTYSKFVDHSWHE